jgi:hypothetical protein
MKRRVAPRNSGRRLAGEAAPGLRRALRARLHPGYEPVILLPYAVLAHV